MNVLIYVLYLVLLATLFFINNFTKKKNSMLFVILICVIGLVSLTISPPQIINGTNSTITYSAGVATSIDTVLITEDFGYTWAWILMFVGLILLGSYNYYIEEEGDDIQST